MVVIIVLQMLGGELGDAGFDYWKRHEKSPVGSGAHVASHSVAAGGKVARA